MSYHGKDHLPGISSPSRSTNPSRNAPDRSKDSKLPAIRGGADTAAGRKQEIDRRGRRGPRGRKGKNSHGKSGNGVRPESRVGKLLAEFAGKDDWVSKTILRHKMAVVIQSVTRGFLVRRHWRTNPQYVVDRLHAQIEAQRTALSKREEVKKKLEQKIMTDKQKGTASLALEAMFGAKARVAASPAKGGSRWAKLANNVDIAEAAMQEASKSTEEALAGNLSESDDSDQDLEDIVALKYRARTPPWQRVEQSQWVGQYNKLNNRTNRGNLDVMWDLDECSDRLGMVKARRLQREDDEAASTSDGATFNSPRAKFDPATQDLPSDLVKDILLEKYEEKWARLGLKDHVPVRYGRLDTGLVEEGPMVLTAVRPGLDDAPIR